MISFRQEVLRTYLQGFRQSHSHYKIRDLTVAGFELVDVGGGCADHLGQSFLRNPPEQTDFPYFPADVADIFCLSVTVFCHPKIIGVDFRKRKG